MKLNKILPVLLIFLAVFTLNIFAQNNTTVTYGDNYTHVKIDSTVYAKVDTVFSEWFSVEQNLGYSYITNAPTFTYQWTSTLGTPKLFVFVEGSNDVTTDKVYKVRIDTISATSDSLETLRFGLFNFNNWKFKYYRIGFQPLTTGSGPGWIGNRTDTRAHLEILFIKPD